MNIWGIEDLSSKTNMNEKYFQSFPTHIFKLKLLNFT